MELTITEFKVRIDDRNGMEPTMWITVPAETNEEAKQDAVNDYLAWFPETDPVATQTVELNSKTIKL